MSEQNNDEIIKMLEQLKAQAMEPIDESELTSPTEKVSYSDEEMRDMLEKQLADDEPVQESEEHSFDTFDFGKLDDEIMSTDEFVVYDEPEIQPAVEEEPEPIIEEEPEPIVEEEPEPVIEEEPEPIVEDEPEPIIEEEPEPVIEEEPEPIVEEERQPIVEEEPEPVIEEKPEPIIEEELEPVIEDEPKPIVEEEPEPIIEEEPEPIVEDEPQPEPDEEPIAEESINYDEVLEGQQGTVFNKFVEDFTGELDDVVFEAEITESRAPDKQYTIFEDWEKLMKDKSYATAEEEIIPPSADELAQSAEISERASGKTDYFTAQTSADLDAVDIALMVALGGESELNRTVGFEKIRQAVHSANEEKSEDLSGKSIFGCCGEEYSSLVQNAKIKEKYKKDKRGVIIRLVLTAIMTALILAYDIAGRVGYVLPGIFNMNESPRIYVLAGLQLVFLCAVISYNKFKDMFTGASNFSSMSFVGAVIALLVCVLHDVLLMFTRYVPVTMSFHPIPAIMLLISLIYDLFDVIQQSHMFGVISLSDKKLVLEPYGKVRMDENEKESEVLDKDSYCISRVPTVSRFFARIAEPTTNAWSKFISPVLCLSVSLCILLVLVLMGKDLITAGLAATVSCLFSLLCSVIFESEFAFFAVHRSLKKYKTGIIGKSGVSEYGKCNIIYFDDYNVFNKKSVRTKGLKLYDNNEIYRVLYHTQAVFSKVGGPLKGVFEFATSEMIHSKNVEIREINKEGISAFVDGRTSVLIGTGAFLRGHGIHPTYTAADMRAEAAGEESIMFIALGGKLGAKLYVTYRFSSEFERLARKLTAKGVRIGIRSCDPNINDKWAKHYGELKKFDISIVRPTLKEIKPRDKSIDGGVASVKNVRALAEALMMCIKLDSFESVIGKMRIASIVLVAMLTLALVLFAGIDTVSLLVLSLTCALGASIMMLMTHFYIKR